MTREDYLDGARIYDPLFILKSLRYCIFGDHSFTSTRMS